MRKFTVISITMVLLFGCRNQHGTVSQQFTMPTGTPDIANGKNLTFNVCGQCHYDHNAKSFIGEEMRELPGIMGDVYSANLTHGHVVDAYSDKELFYLIKTGIAKNGKLIPYMIRPNIADKDLMDIIAYLRSDDKPIQRNDSNVGNTDLTLIGKLANKMGMKPQEFKTVAQPSSDPVETGRYLVDNIGCYHCHSKSILGLNYGNPEDSKGYMAGGMKFKVDGHKEIAPNLTPDKETGIGNYTRTSFRKALRDGIALNGKELDYPMPHFKQLTDEQSDAIFAYLQTLKPVKK